MITLGDAPIQKIQTGSNSDSIAAFVNVKEEDDKIIIAIAKADSSLEICRLKKSNDSVALVYEKDSTKFHLFDKSLEKPRKE